MRPTNPAALVDDFARDGAAVVRGLVGGALLAELLEGDPGDEFYDAKVKVLSEEILHHVHEEEKRNDGMFTQARDAGVDLDDLGRRLAKRKEELAERFAQSGLPAPETRTLRGAELRHGHAIA